MSFRNLVKRAELLGIEIITVKDFEGGKNWLNFID